MKLIRLTRLAILCKFCLVGDEVHFYGGLECRELALKGGLAPKQEDATIPICAAERRKAFELRQTAIASRLPEFCQNFTLHGKSDTV